MVIEFFKSVGIFLFGGSLPIMGVYLLAVFIDLMTGYVVALKSHNWHSAINLWGILTKLTTIFAIIAAAILDNIGPFFGIVIPINIALWATGFLTLYEISSILENFAGLGIKLGFIKKYLGIFNEQMNGKDDENE
ncbi:phage holin family protein [Carnobacterium gallinarum]|uniref:phage holin family protein n=1 Tax=Carnobacterium gallinarum TaxID=2749 RepID=UPI0005526A12|nr:phage holin family protein [Carnobacterium gallinarum]